MVCAGLIIFLSMGTRQSFGLFLTPMSGDLGFGREVFALAMAIQALMSGLLQPVTGAIADKFGARGVAFIGGLLYVGVHFPAFLGDQELPPDLAATAIGLIGLFNIFGTIGFGWLGGRYSKKLLPSGIYFARSVLFTIFLVLPITQTSVLIFSSALGILWLSTVPLTGGLVAQVFGVRYMTTLFGIVFMSHQFGSFMGAWLGGFLFDATGSYDLMWKLIIASGLVATIMHLPIREKPIERGARSKV